LRASPARSGLRTHPCDRQDCHGQGLPSQVARIRCVPSVGGGGVAGADQGRSGRATVGSAGCSSLVPARSRWQASALVGSPAMADAGSKDVSDFLLDSHPGLADLALWAREAVLAGEPAAVSSSTARPSRPNMSGSMTTDMHATAGLGAPSKQCIGALSPCRRRNGHEPATFSLLGTSMREGTCG
jgi:hypothetical protein